jgi:hypothetical protein
LVAWFQSLNRKFPVIAVVAAAHLGVVICGAARLRFDGPSNLDAALGVYGAYSGANNSYGFFAPGVAAQWRASFDFYDRANKTWTTRTRVAPNLELAVLDSTITGLFSHEKLRQALAASWAGMALAETPGAAVVVVRAEAFIVPTMEQYRRGVRGEWRSLAAYAFTTDDRSSVVDLGATGGQPR